MQQQRQKQIQGFFASHRMTTYNKQQTTATTRATATMVLQWLVLGFFEDHGVEVVAGEEANALVEFDCLLVSFGDGKGEGVEACG
jgi:hypothetical protein